MVIWLSERRTTDGNHVSGDLARGEPDRRSGARHGRVAPPPHQTGGGGLAELDDGRGPRACRRERGGHLRREPRRWGVEDGRKQPALLLPLRDGRSPLRQGAGRQGRGPHRHAQPARRARVARRDAREDRGLLHGGADEGVPRRPPLLSVPVRPRYIGIETNDLRSGGYSITCNDKVCARSQFTDQTTYHQLAYIGCLIL